MKRLILVIVVLAVVGLALLLFRWYRRSPVGEIQALPSTAFYDPGQKVTLGLPVESPGDVLWSWTTHGGGSFEGPANSSHVIFVAPDTGSPTVICSVIVGDRAYTRKRTLTVKQTSIGPITPLVAVNPPANPSPAPQVNGSVILPDGGAILNGSQMGSNLGLGVDTSEHKRDWVKPAPANGSLMLAYPGDPLFGAAFFTVGKPRDDHRPGTDMSAFNALEVELQGQQAGDIVYVGIKDATQPDDGSEWKEKVTLTTDWVRYQFPLSKFVGADVHRLYVLCEFVFRESPAAVYVRRIQFVKNQ